MEPCLSTCSEIEAISFSTNLEALTGQFFVASMVVVIGGRDTVDFVGGIELDRTSTLGT